MEGAFPVRCDITGKMASPSLEYFNSVWQYIPQGHEKALKQAFYNTASNIFIVFAGAALIAVYFILNPFLRPLCWAVLCGTFLYPLKRSLTNVLKKWLNCLRISDTPFAVGVVIFPVQVVNHVSDNLLSGIRNNFAVVAGLLLGMPLLQFMYYYGAVQTLFYVALSSLNLCHEVTGWFSSMWLWTIFVGYVIAVIFLWTEESKMTFHYIAIAVWITFILHVTTLAGPLRLFLLACFVVVMVIGFVSDGHDGSGDKPSVAPTENKEDSAPNQAGEWKSIFDNDQTTQEVKGSQPPASTQTPQSLALTSTTRMSKPGGVDKRDAPAENVQYSLSNQCFLVLFAAHVVVRLWIHIWALILILFLPLLLLIVRAIGRKDGYICTKFGSVSLCLKNWYQKRKDAITPRSVSGLAKIALKGDKKVIDVLEMSTDKATSILLILFLLIGSVLFIIVGAIQIHQESVHMLTVTSNLFNEKVNPEIKQWLPNSSDMEKAMDSVAENAYIYGRDYITSMVRSITNGQNNKEMETRVLELWDQLYESWFAKNSSSDTRVKKTVGFPDMTNMTAMWEMVSHGDGLFNMGSLVAFAQENIGTFMSVFESIWLVIKGNMDLMMSMMTAILSVLLGGGTAILNFIISAILFLTTLFYLLSSSGNQYKPLEWFSSMSLTGSQGSSKFGIAVEEAISGVFMASLKMASFYGLFTWLTHLVFGVNVVFIPSALAAIFGAVPFVGTYWAAVPAMLELWLGQGRGVMAILLLIVHMLPAYVVDTAIYSEIKGGHPFMTGLAIAGGMYCLGLEGAIIGPIVLCFLVVVVNIYGTMMQPETSTPRGAPRL